MPVALDVHVPYAVVLNLTNCVRMHVYMCECVSGPRRPPFGYEFEIFLVSIVGVRNQETYCNTPVGVCAVTATKYQRSHRGYTHICVTDTNERVFDMCYIYGGRSTDRIDLSVKRRGPHHRYS